MKELPFTSSFHATPKVSYETNSEIGGVIVTSFSLSHTHTCQNISSWIKWLATGIMVAFQSKSLGVQA